MLKPFLLIVALFVSFSIWGAENKKAVDLTVPTQTDPDSDQIRNFAKGKARYVPKDGKPGAPNCINEAGEKSRPGDPRYEACLVEFEKASKRQPLQPPNPPGTNPNQKVPSVQWEINPSDGK